jgi:OmcA/MtrC family decaheme c-type cytochrome
MGADGAGCTAVAKGDGTYTITCGDDVVTVSDGKDVDAAVIDDLHKQVADLTQAQKDSLAAVGGEACAVCHSKAAQVHQGVYDKYSDTSLFSLAITKVTSSAAGSGLFNASLTFTLTKNGLAVADLNTLAQKRFSVVRYSSSSATPFTESVTFGTLAATGNPGEYTASASNMAYDPVTTSAVAYGYVAEGELPTEGMTLYDNVANASLPLPVGSANIDYVSPANVSGCEKCHGSPYLKHGYRAAKVAGIPDFVACKSCHYDDRAGGHFDWQIMVDNPVRAAEIHEGSPVTAEEETKYAYKATIMNDVHMSHGMQFQFPQTIANCVTCHEGKLDEVLDDKNFTLATCKSCHAVTGDADYAERDRAPALSTLWPSFHADYGNTNPTCTVNCHGSAAPSFKTLHPGFDKVIYADAATRYNKLFAVVIDSAALTRNTLNVKFHATEDPGSSVAENPDDIVPTLLVGLYGWDTKDFYVTPHGIGPDGQLLLEFELNGSNTNPRLLRVEASGGAWDVDIDLSMWAGMITDGTVKRAEIGVMPKLEVSRTVVALDAPSKTLDIAKNGFDAYFSPIVDAANCNKCHDALDTRFHPPDRGGNVTVCRMCHVPSAASSHLEMQSRSIESFVHSLHSFQALDSGSVDFTDSVEKMRYELHVASIFPNFTTLNCQSCHAAGTFGVSDQSKALPGQMSGSDNWRKGERKIGDFPSYVTGPSSRACGGCHRADLIKKDDANGLASLNKHIASNGYMVENPRDLLDAIVKKVMALFN